MITRDRFCAVQARCGYQVQNLGTTVFLRHSTNHSNYVAVWYWNEDGTLDETREPKWFWEHKVSEEVL